MDPNSRLLMLGSGGSPAVIPGPNIEELFATYLYDGNGGSQTIDNGIALSSDGGAVFLKERGLAFGSSQFVNASPTMGSGWGLNTTSTSAASANGYVTFPTAPANGFTLPNDGGGNTNYTGGRYASWCFKKEPKFFDVVFYSGTGASTPSISHNLGCKPKLKIIKAISTGSTGDWVVGGEVLGDRNNYIVLNSSTGLVSSSNYWDALDTATTFSVRANNGNSGGNGVNYIAYLFAGDEAVFGETGDQTVMKIGKYTGNGTSSPPIINCGWEPQFLIIKKLGAAAGNASDDWCVIDVNRVIPADDNDSRMLSFNLGSGENFGNFTVNARLLPDGFQAGGQKNQSGVEYLYIAVRRGDMGTPTSATTLFSADRLNEPASTPTVIQNNHLVDAFWVFNDFGAEHAADRLRGQNKYLNMSTSTEETGFIDWRFDSQTGVGYGSASNATQYGVWMFRRANGYFDVCCYRGGGSSASSSPGRMQRHNLGVVPELAIVKLRTNWTNPASTYGGDNWYVYHKDLGYANVMRLDTNAAAGSGPILGSSTSATELELLRPGYDSLATDGADYTYVWYLFASIPGVSKVGTYNGTGSTINVDCGFSAGARFVMIKRSDSTGSWYCWSVPANGITTGTERYFRLDDATSTSGNDYIDPYNPGFSIPGGITAELNDNGGVYRYLAIA